MRRIYTGLAIWNLLFLTAFAGFGAAHVLADVGSTRFFQGAALFTAVFCCLIQSMLIIHFIGSMKWIQQSGPTAGIEDTKPLRTAWTKSRAFPLIHLTPVIAVAAAILSGGAATGSTSPWPFLVLAFVNIPLCALALHHARAALATNRERMREVEQMMDVRIASGVVAREEKAAHLLPQSEMAAGKVMIFLGVNVWVLFAYFRFVLRHRHHPWWPYAALSGLAVLLGWWMLRMRPAEDEPTGAQA